MKLLTLILLQVLIAFNSFGQSSEEEKSNQKYTACNSEQIFMIAAVPPEYEGGLKKLERQLEEQLSLDKKVNAIVFLRFIINCEGKAFDFESLKAKNQSTALKVQIELQKLQNWKAGLQSGKAIDCYKVLNLKVKNGKIKIK